MYRIPLKAAEGVMQLLAQLRKTSAPGLAIRFLVWRIFHRNRKRRGALEYDQSVHLRCDRLYDLNAGCAGTNNTDPLARIVDALLRPPGGVYDTSGESLVSLKGRHLRCRENAAATDQVARSEAISLVRPDGPAPCSGVPVSRFNAGVKTKIAPEVKAIGNMCKVAHQLRLG